MSLDSESQLSPLPPHLLPPLSLSLGNCPRILPYHRAGLSSSGGFSSWDFLETGQLPPALMGAALNICSTEWKHGCTTHSPGAPGPTSTKPLGNPSYNLLPVSRPNGLVRSPDCLHRMRQTSGPLLKPSLYSEGNRYLLTAACLPSVCTCGLGYTSPSPRDRG